MIVALLTLVFCVLVARIYLALFAYTPRHASQGKVRLSSQFIAHKQSLQITWNSAKGMWI